MSLQPSAEQMLAPDFSLLSIGVDDSSAIECAVMVLIKTVVAFAVEGDAGGGRDEGSTNNSTNSVLSRIDVDEDLLRRFIHKIGTMYRSTPYHNFWHALCVCRECALIVKALHGWALRPREQDPGSSGTDATLVTPAPFFTARELFTIMVSALVHDGKLTDWRANALSLSLPIIISISRPTLTHLLSRPSVDHPGTNNDFEIKSRSKLAVLYNDISVLENHHLSLTFSLLQSPGFDIFGRWNASDISEAQAIITNAVLYTDMALHKSLTLDLLSRAESPPAYDLSQSSARHALVNIILHTADIFNPARPSAVSASISRQVCTEFLSQAAMEKAAALPVTPWMSGLDNELAVAKGELGFARFVARPYFAALAACFVGGIIEGLNFVPQIDENISAWEAEIARLSGLNYRLLRCAW
jgi:hypothetical protein